MAITFKLLCISLLTSICVLGAAAQDPDYAIVDYIISGTGCAPGSVAAEITADHKDISVKYSGFTARAGPDYGYDSNRKNCQLTLSVQVPAGYQFALDKSTHEGSYSVGSGVKASYSTTYYFQSSLEQSSAGGNFTVPAKAAGVFSDTFSTSLWSPCGKSALVGINTAIRVDNGDNSKASGSFTLKNAPTSSLIWRAC